MKLEEYYPEKSYDWQFYLQQEIDLEALRVLHNCYDRAKEVFLLFLNSIFNNFHLYGRKLQFTNQYFADTAAQ